MKKQLVFFIAAVVLVFPSLVGSANAYRWDSEDDGEASIEGTYQSGIAQYTKNTLQLGEDVIAVYPINQGATATGSMYVLGYATETGSVTGTINFYTKGHIAGGGISANAWITIKFQAIDVTQGATTEAVMLHKDLVWSDEGTWRWGTMDIPLYYGHQYEFALWAEVHADVFGLGGVIADFGLNWGGWTDCKIQWGYIDVPNVILVPPHTLSISSSSGGTTEPAPGTHVYGEGTYVSVYAFPMPDYAFSYWSLDGTVFYSNPIGITMNTDHSLKAYFVPTYTLSISSSNGGTTAPTPGAYVYNEGTYVSVQAIPDANYAFSHWMLDGTIFYSNPIGITMNTDHSLKAYFAYVSGGGGGGGGHNYPK